MTITSTTTGRQVPDDEGPSEHDEAPDRFRIGAVLVAGTVLVGLVLRFVASSALWLDEAISVDFARLSIGRLDNGLRQDGHPPLYYVLLHGWTSLFGTSDVAVRSLAGVISVATLPLVWAAGRRLGGRRTAAIALVLMATSPFAIRYATEARMYALVTLLALAGYLAVLRALESPNLGRLALVSVLTAASLYTHYWGLWLAGGASVILLVTSQRQAERRPGSRRVMAAMALGGLAFVPWLPILLYQARHTGTPWAKSVEPLDAGFDTLIDFGGGKWAGGRLLGPILAVLVLFALIARPLDRWRMELDLRTLPGARALIGVATATMALGLLVAVAGSGAFQPRYAAGVFPFVILAAAVGVGRLPSPRAQWGVVAVVALAGFAGAVHNDQIPRTQAAEVAGALDGQAGPGDLVVYCPDQLRPAVQRQLDRRSGPPLRAVAYPRGGPPGRIDWVDYESRIDAESPVTFAQDVLDSAGPSTTIWLVSAESYRSFGTRCEDIRSALTAARGAGQTVVERDRDAYEKATLLRFPPR